ncbi:hypothetical protein L873DRAFT_1820254, partial [Choiromyces venosus 120613-1]
IPPLRHPQNHITKQLIMCEAVYAHMNLFKSPCNTPALSGEAFLDELLHGHTRPFFDEAW